MQTEIATGLGLLAGVLVLGGVGLAFAHNAKGAGSPTPELPAAGVIAPGVQSVQIPAGSSFGLALPAGATWGQGALIAGGTVVQLTYTNNEALVTVPPAIATVGIQWKDAAGRQQFTLILILPPGVSAQSPVTDTPAQTNAQALLVDVAKQNVPGLSYPAATGMDARFAARAAGVSDVLEPAGGAELCHTDRAAHDGRARLPHVRGAFGHAVPVMRTTLGSSTTARGSGGGAPDAPIVMVTGPR